MKFEMKGGKSKTVDGRRKINCRLFFILFLLLTSHFSLLTCLYSETPKPSLIIDIPTAEVIEYSNYDLSFRMHGAGGILSKMTFGVFKPINIGISWDVDKLIGTGSEKIDTQPPAILFKARVFAGGLKLPAISLGYDGQGYGTYDGDTDKYQYREKGIYLTLTREYFVPGLEMSFGGNIYDFDGDGVYGFLGATFGIENKLLFLTEYDNIKSMPDNRANIGIKLFITDNVDVSVAGRNLFKGTRSERIAIVNYRGKF